MKQSKPLSGVSSVSQPGPQGMLQHFKGGDTKTHTTRKNLSKTKKNSFFYTNICFYLNSGIHTILTLDQSHGKEIVVLAVSPEIEEVTASSAHNGIYVKVTAPHLLYVHFLSQAMAASLEPTELPPYMSAHSQMPQTVYQCARYLYETPHHRGPFFPALEFILEHVTLIQSLSMADTPPIHQAESSATISLRDPCILKSRDLQITDETSLCVATSHPWRNSTYDAESEFMTALASVCNEIMSTQEKSGITTNINMKKRAP